MPLLAGGVVSLVLLRGFFDFEWMAPALAGWCLITQAWHIVDYERGAAKPATDFTITLAGIVFLGWIGAYLVSLRLMANGLWWLLLTLPTIWTADAGAYIVGHAIGRRKLAPRVSPQKTWEGYLAGGMIGTIGGAGLALLWRIGAGPDSGLTALNGLILGAAISFVAPIGDLGISMLKREMHVKDTSGLIPGHGGAMDRMDSWLWAGVIAYYMINHLLVG
jgi:phosphatidate cytidylyltransferase